MTRNPTGSDTVNILGGRMNAPTNYDTRSFMWDGSSFTNYGDTILTKDYGSSASLTETMSIAFRII